MKHVSASNRKAGFDISVEQRYEAGIVLTGDEIKSIRAGRMQLTGSYVKLMRSRTRGDLPQAIVIGLYLSMAKEPDRSRRLLLHAKELEEIAQALQAKGRVAVPLRLYIKKGWAKVLIGVGSGRRMYDKRQVLKNRDADRQSQRELKRLK